MEKQKLADAIHSAIHKHNIKKISKLKDFFKDTNRGNISNINTDILNEKKEIFNWILDNPNYKFNELFDNHFLTTLNYSNDDIYKYSKLYHERILFLLEKYEKKEFNIKYEDFD